jgi:hypothetical protein
MRKEFPHPEQTSNGFSDKSLMKELDLEEHADGVALALDVINSDQMKHINAYVSMPMRQSHSIDQPIGTQLCSKETCSTMMRIDQISASCQDEQ